jgi:hypothetical protein|tara:strand:+ start:621 stop:2270 length:1650 start_codon:yes stop_codon:yes gene_type:complete
MAEDEIQKLAGNLSDLNKVTLDAGVEFKGFTKRLIEISDSTSKAGKKWTIFARLVSGSPLWRLQNKFRAFIDILGQVEQASQANAKLAQEQNQRVIEQVQAYETLAPQLDLINQLHEEGRFRTEVQEEETKQIMEAVKATYAYSVAMLEGADANEQFSRGLEELVKKGKQQTKVFEEAQKVAQFEKAMKTKEGRAGISADITKEQEALKEEFFLTKTPSQATTQLELFKEIEDKISATLRLGERRQKFQENMAKRTLKYRKGMISLQKTMKPVLNYAFKVMIMLMLGIMGFLVLAKFIHDSLGILEEMGVIDDIMKIGSLVLDNVMLIFSMIGALLSGDIYTFLDYALEFVDNLLMIAWDILIVILKGLLALAIATFYTGLDIIHKFFTDEQFRSTVFKIAKKALFVFLAAYVVKQIMIQMLTVVAIYALPALVILGLTALLFAVVKKLGDIIKDTFKLDFMANGGVSGGGMTVVGERGPELVNLPKGARVHSNNESKKMGGGVVNNNVSVTINAKDTSDAELRRIAEKIGNLISSKMNRSTSSSGFVR